MRTNPSRAGRLLVTGMTLVLAACAAPPVAAPPPAPSSSAPVPPASPVPQPKQQVPQPTQEVPTPEQPVPMPARPQLDPAVVTAAVRSVQGSATVGGLVLDRQTGQELLAIEPDRPFRSASLVKLLVAIDTLARGADERTRGQITPMLRVSNDAVGSLLWSKAGGYPLVERTAATLGLTGTSPPSPPGRWGNVPLTPRDVGRIYQFVLTALPAADRALIVDSMAGAPRAAADGFDQHFGIPRALPEPWAIKQGWSNSASDIVVHSSGLVGADWRYVVVVLTEHPRRVSWRTAAASVTAGAQALSPLLQPNS